MNDHTQVNPDRYLSSSSRHIVLNLMRSLKAVVVGEARVGKSCIINRFVVGSFADNIQPTIGAAMSTQIVNLDSGPVKLQIWDTAGQENYRSLSPHYFRGANVAILVFDLTSLESLENLDKWAAEIADRAPANIKIVLVGNKADLVNQRTVSKDALHGIYRSISISHYFETSALTGEGVNDLFTYVASNDPLENTVFETKTTIQRPIEPQTGCSC